MTNPRDQLKTISASVESTAHDELESKRAQITMRLGLTKSSIQNNTDNQNSMRPITQLRIDINNHGSGTCASWLQNYIDEKSKKYALTPKLHQLPSEEGDDNTPTSLKNASCQEYALSNNLLVRKKNSVPINIQSINLPGLDQSASKLNRPPLHPGSSKLPFSQKNVVFQQTPISTVLSSPQIPKRQASGKR